MGTVRAARGASRIAARIAAGGGSDAGPTRTGRGAAEAAAARAERAGAWGLAGLRAPISGRRPGERARCRPGG